MTKRRTMIRTHSLYHTQPHPLSNVGGPTLEGPTPHMRGSVTECGRESVSVSFLQSVIDTSFLPFNLNWFLSAGKTLTFATLS